MTASSMFVMPVGSQGGDHQLQEHDSDEDCMYCQHRRRHHQHPRIGDSSADIQSVSTFSCCHSNGEIESIGPNMLFLHVVSDILPSDDSPLRGMEIWVVSVDCQFASDQIDSTSLPIFDVVLYDDDISHLSSSVIDDDVFDDENSSLPSASEAVNSQCDDDDDDESMYFEDEISYLPRASYAASRLLKHSDDGHHGHVTTTIPCFYRCSEAIFPPVCSRSEDKSGATYVSFETSTLVDYSQAVSSKRHEYEEQIRAAWRVGPMHGTNHQNY
jgi:hypothetical protein